MKSSLSTALLMAGGHSARMREGGDPRHKALRTVQGQPLIAWNLRALLAFGFSEIVVAMNRREHALAAWVEREAASLAQSFGACCTALVEDEPLGTIGAIARVPSTWANVLVTNVDNLTDLHLRDLADRHVASGAAATVATHTQPFRIPFGRLDVEGDTVTGYYEKPVIPVPICSGTTVFARRAIAHVAHVGPTDLPTLIESLLHAGEHVHAFRHQSRWIDVNNEAALASAEGLLREADGSWPGSVSSAPHVPSRYEQWQSEQSANRPLRVLTLTPDLGFGGGENRILNLARSIDRDRIEMTVACLYARDAARDDRSGTLHPEFRAAGIPVRSFDLPRAQARFRSRALQLLCTAWTLVRASVRLRQAILALDVDVIDAHMDGTLLIAVTAAVLARRPVAVTLYHVNTVPPNRWLLPLRLLSLRFVDAIITDSAARASDFTRALPRAQAPIHVIPNGVRLPPVKCSRAEVLRHFDIPESAAQIIGQVSGLVPIKGHLVLLRSLAPILAARPDTYLLCVGFTRETSGHIDELRREITKLGIARQVRIGSWPGAIADAWNVIDLHVHATLFDSLPNAILEGMSLGKPCVVTAVGGIPDAVLNGKTGLVVPPNDPDVFREAVLTVLDDPALAQRLGEAARRRYLQHYTPECCARAVESTLLTVANRNAVALPVLA